MNYQLEEMQKHLEKLVAVVAEDWASIYTEEDLLDPTKIRFRESFEKYKSEVINLKNVLEKSFLNLMKHCKSNIKDRAEI